MRLVIPNGLRFRHLRLVILAFCGVFLLWKWEKGSLYSPDLLRPEPLALSEFSRFSQILPQELVFFQVPPCGSFLELVSPVNF
jgi:hypothetical protein